MSIRPLVLCAAVLTAGCSDLPTLPAPVRPPLPSTVGAFVLSAAPPPAGSPADPPIEIANAPIPTTSAEPTPSAAPSVGPTAAPSAEPSPTPSASATPAPASGGSGGGGSGGGGSGGGGSALGGRPPNILRVVDEVGQKVVGATVALGGTDPLTTNASGEVDVPGVITGLAVVSAPGFVPSVVSAITSDITTVHLRRAGGQSPEFHQHQSTVQGTIADHTAWLAPHVFFANAMRAGGQPVTAVGGAFNLNVVRNGAELPVGVAFVIAGRLSDGALMYGASRPVTPFSQTAPLPQTIATPITLAPATRRIDYLASFPIGELDRGETLLMFQPDDPTAKAVPIESSKDPTGVFWATADGALPGTWRVQMVASDVTGDLTTVAIVDPRDGSAVASLLSSPRITGVTTEQVKNEGFHRVRWAEVAAAKGYRVEIRRDGIEGPTWEAWTGTDETVAVPDADWPGPGEGHVIVQAIDAEGVSTRSLASVGALGAPRRLRIEPWTAQPLYKVATARRRT